MSHFVTEGGSNAGGRHNLQRSKEGGQEINVDGTGEGDVDFRGNLEVGRLEDIPEAETHNRPTRNPGIN